MTVSWEMLDIDGVNTPNAHMYRAEVVGGWLVLFTGLFEVMPGLQGTPHDLNAGAGGLGVGITFYLDPLHKWGQNV